MMKACIKLIVSLLLLVHQGMAQTSPVSKADSLGLFTSSLQGIAMYTGDSVILRWSPAKAGGWQAGNQLGYIIEKTVLSHDSVLSPDLFRQLNNAVIKPWPLNDWARIAGEGKDKYAAIAAQALYGKGFHSTGLLDQADEFQNRFSFALLAADLSPGAATALGLRWVDREVEPNRVYVYRIFTARTSPHYKLDTAYVVVNTSEREILPPVEVMKVEEDDQLISFFWNRALYNHYYSAYHIERSDDGKTFSRITQEPYINPVSPEHKGNQEVVVYSDSVASNYTPYYYRIRGLTPFGEISSPSQVLKAMGRDRTPPQPPVAVQAIPLNSSTVRISWEKEQEEPDIAGYIIGRSQHPAGTFHPLFTSVLPKGTRSFVDQQAVDQGTNYYKVSVLDTAGNLSNSLVSYALMIDSLPPAPPKGLKGTVDTAGVVSLSWQLGRERNLKGYIVYVANAKDHPFSSVVNKPLQDTLFTDSIQMSTLTEKIYYCLKAVDANFSFSKSSDTLELRRPDVISPTSPVFTSYKITAEGILLHWINSSSHDAVRTVLLRSADDAPFREIARFSLSDQVTHFLDKEVEHQKIYAYALRSIDDAGLQSEVRVPMRVKMTKKEERPAVSNLRVEKPQNAKHLQLSWSYAGQGVARFEIFRAVNGGNFITYKSVGPEAQAFDDRNIRPGSRYEYTMKVRFTDGRSSSFGNRVLHQE